MFIAGEYRITEGAKTKRTYRNAGEKRPTYKNCKIERHNNPLHAIFISQQMIAKV